MSNTTWTKGRWTPRRRSDDTWVIRDNNDQRICEVKAGNSANARLIAAAPELYEALMGMVEDAIATADSGDCGFYDAEEVPVVARAITALAKARGEM